jgi:hypothetical protein
MVTNDETKGGADRLLNRLGCARERIEDRQRRLAVIADWRDYLAQRIAREQLRLELLDPDEDRTGELCKLDELHEEAADFSRVCQTLASAWHRAASQRGAP